MGRLLTFIALGAALAAPAALANDDPSPQNGTTAAAQCKAQRKSMGLKDFRLLWGTNKSGHNAFGNCVALTAQQNQDNVKSAEEQCRAERASDPSAFDDRYGTDPNGHNAFGKCVSQTAKSESQDDQQDVVNAAKACKAERAQDPAAFRAKYHAKHGKRSAFARCVSTRVKQK